MDYYLGDDPPATPTSERDDRIGALLHNRRPRVRGRVDPSRHHVRVDGGVQDRRVGRR
jgi:hypothetical protein